MTGSSSPSPCSGSRFSPASSLRPEAGRISKLIEREGSDSPAVHVRIRRILALTRADLVLLFLIVYDMVVKPSFDDAGVILGALIVAVGVAALLVWAGLRTADSTRIADHSPQ